ncbi:hypothetical protein Rhopal_003017-T1 [Rhodotorula paludigena]|uniref:Centromere protein X n=1 Tax=Rhodotorula paludigena TaxID=86838 RepID=A0AAV5GBV2_9BASI|nr:hypothetical protein Rhopal_003017-T1 [Rhodotorula paludigena]
MSDQEADADHPQFKQATVKELFKLVTEPNTRVSAAAAQLSAEYLRLFATEAIHRAAEVAEKERSLAGGAPSTGPPELLETKHLEKVLAGLLLDFS